MTTLANRQHVAPPIATAHHLLDYGGWSIIIPTLNEEKFIASLLACLAQQTYRRFEVIVVDGSSMDGTRTVVNSFAGKLDVKLVDSRRRNVGLQRNAGAEHAHYERLLFLDADCTFGRNFLGKLGEVCANTGVDVGTVTTLLEDGTFFENVFFRVIDVTFRMLQYVKPYSLGAVIVATKSVHRRTGGFPETFAQNFEYVRRACRHGKFRYLANIAASTSARRFARCGSLRVTSLWIRAFLCHFFFNRIVKSDHVYDQHDEAFHVD